MSKNKKKIIFLTGTRADFGKLKSLISITKKSKLFDINIFVTGMHLDKKFGYTIDEIKKSGFKSIFSLKNNTNTSKMELILANTVKGFSKYIHSNNPDLIVVHGDRIEALAGAIVGSLNNILVGHIEGGELSGTIDELIRHAITKMSHLHFVSNKEAFLRLIQLGELKKSIHIIGSPDLDLMNPKKLQSEKKVKSYYGIKYDNYAIAMYHPVTTEVRDIKKQIKIFIESLKRSNKKYILIYPNNDTGSDIIIDEYKTLKKNKNFKIFRSLRFEYFLTLLYNCDFIVGNSSAGIKEAPYYNIPSINIGSRQQNRSNQKSINHCECKAIQIQKCINKIEKIEYSKKSINFSTFGSGNSDKLFLKIIKNKIFWKTNKQKQFQDKNI